MAVNPEGSLERATNRRRLLQVLLNSGTASRVALAEWTGLSRPTVNSIIADLETDGLVKKVGAVPSPGRHAALYRVHTEAHTVIGIDIGGSRIRGALADLAGKTRVMRQIPTRSQEPGVVERVVALSHQLLREGQVGPESLRAFAVGVPGVLNSLTGHMENAINVPELEQLDLRHALQERLGVPGYVDNDANMAIIGEHWLGRAKGTQDAVFIAVGNGLGAGILAGGSLQRGHTGFAGELDGIPVRRFPAHEEIADFSVEHFVTAKGIAEAYRSSPDDSDVELPDIFSQATSGSSRALGAVDQAAWYLAQVIMTIQGVLDPERVILGGGIGAHPLTVGLVRSHLSQSRRFPLVVEPTGLDGQATLYGAIHTALMHARLTVGMDANPDFTTTVPSPGQARGRAHL